MSTGLCLVRSFNDYCESHINHWESMGVFAAGLTAKVHILRIKMNSARDHEQEILLSDTSEGGSTVPGFISSIEKISNEYLKVKKCLRSIAEAIEQSEGASKNLTATSTTKAEKDTYHHYVRMLKELQTLISYQVTQLETHLAPVRGWAARSKRALERIKKPGEERVSITPEGASILHSIPGVGRALAWVGVIDPTGRDLPEEKRPD